MPFALSHGHCALPTKPRSAAHSGQNLVELALTLPLMLLLVFFTIDAGRAWMTYESAKMAVRSASYTASIYHSASVGQTQLNNKLAASGLKGTGIVKQIPNQHAYQSSVKVTFTPLFAHLSIPTISGPQRVLPADINITYAGVTDVSVY
ncbi:TadE/TadG family type IV pilus assembly protein [Vampirovibrio sp.]|uniref:TadE/TadG family type IV pilus assembly protein n=1 Tax=Vampirovibrio sp. TaxID=2717857 RepID=UPI0035939EBE